MNKEIDYNLAFCYNRSIEKSVTKSLKRHLFYTKFIKTKPLYSIVHTLTGDDLFYRVIFKLERIVKRVIGQ